MVVKDCLCGISVHTGTLIVAFVVLVSNLLWIISNMVKLAGSSRTSAMNVVANSSEHTAFDKFFEMYDQSMNAMPIVNVVVGILTGIFVVLLIYGNRTRKPGFYCPFILIMIIDIILGVIVCVGMLIFAIISFVSPSTLSYSTQEGSVAGVAFLIMFVFIGIIYLIHYYFYYLIPSRSRRLLIEEKEAVGGENSADKHPVES